MDKIIKAYAHDYRDMAMNEINLEEMLEAFWMEMVIEMERRNKETVLDHLLGDRDD